MTTTKRVQAPMGLRAAARALCTTTGQVRRWCQAGILKGEKRGGSRVVCEVSVLALLAERASFVEEPKRAGVYIVKSDELPRYKIGYTSDLSNRLKMLRNGSPTPLSVAAFIEGAPHAVEQDLHKRFKSSRIHGEWFTETPELLAFCAEQVEAL